jgi:hypothetical protein
MYGTAGSPVGTIPSLIRENCLLVKEKWAFGWAFGLTQDGSLWYGAVSFQGA